MKVSIYTDGSARGNPDGPGGYGTILEYVDSKGELHTKELSKGYEKTTNNRMELIAVLTALEQSDLYGENSRIFSDSAYVVNAFLQNWIWGWIENSWKNSNKEEVKNKELWQELLSLTKIHDVTFHKVKGHADNEYNNRCDELARNAIKSL